MPGLVALVGIFLTLAGDRALRGSNLEVASDRLAEQTRLVAYGVRHALEQADPVLDRLRPVALLHDPEQPSGPFAHTLFDLMQGRPGVAYVSASYPDGTFQAAYLDDDEVIRFQESHVRPGGTMDRRYRFAGRDSLVLEREERSEYDPRKRGFYRLAVERGARIWTKPYPFFGTHYTGVTRAEPVFVTREGRQQLHAVLTVDFDVNALSAYLRNQQLPGMRALLYASDGTVLAYPQASAAAIRLRLAEDRTLHYRDVKDPVVDAFFEAAPAQLGSATVLSVPNQGERYLVAVAEASKDPDLAWRVAHIAPQSYFLRGLYQYETRSFAIGGAAVLTAMLIGWLFARHVVNVRREAAQARAEAREARRAARELGSYRLVASLGKGGMGEVWRAEHRLLAREAAIKIINAEAGGSSNQEMRTRFRREAETLASLRSRNTIELFDYGVADDGTFYYVMELLDGMDFENLVAAHGPLPAARVIRFIVQACNSLAEAHDAGLVHRDIKPANLFICRAADEVDLVKVLDFGLVRSAPSTQQLALETTVDGLLVLSKDGRLTQAGGLMGTPAYMAPEQALGRSMDQRADLYSLGCVAFWLLTGRMLFEERNPMLVMLAHVQTPPPDLRALVDGYLPEQLVELVASCLRKLPEERPRDARELGQALRAIPIPPEHAWSDEAAQSWWREHRPRRRSLPAALSEPREFQVAGDDTVVAPGSLPT
ncbi:MAG TPA: serine/threonine protein kinase [Polyangiaceae bacterium]|nr:serine/threonine protein kinase [Polyangiaceae bacterium]